MTELFRRAVAAAEKLPDDTQDAVAARLLEEIADEEGWATRFDATSDTQWAALAQMAREAIRSNATSPLEAAFPPLLLIELKHYAGVSRAARPVARCGAPTGHPRLATLDVGSGP